MARKKKEAGGGNNAPWLNTFADLMNLLLCFFILLFALSSVSEQKFEQVSISMANSFGVLKGGGSSIGTGQLISSGMSQLNELDSFFNSMGKTVEGETDTNDITNTEQGVEGTSGSESVLDNSNQIIKENQTSEGTQGTNGTQGSEGTQGTETGSVGINEALAKIQREMATVTSDMYDKVSDLTEQYNLGDYVELSIDPNNRFVQLTLKGTVLYDSGNAEIKKAAEPVLDRIGKILNNFKGYSIEIVGHTDNIPISSSTYKDNNWLSSARALNAAEYLIDQCEIDPGNLKYSGRGEYEPISSNSTAAGRAMNRRIEIKIYNEYSNK